MASFGFRRSISAAAILNPRRVYPSYCRIHHNNPDDDTTPSFPSLGPCQLIVANVLPRCASYGTGNRIGLQFTDKSLLSASFMGFGSSFSRSMSSTSGESPLEGILTEVITDRTVDVASQVATSSEVALAATDSAYPVAALQHLIDGVHSFTGLNWWASIALTTVLIRGATVPLLINQLKSTARLSMMRPHLEELNKKFKESETVDPDAVAKHKQRVMALFKKFGVNPFTPLKGLFIQGPIFISFFFAIRNMAEKVPSFQTGGTLWFIDLTTPDSFYILPILTSLTFWITVECNMQEGMEGNPIAGTMKNFSRILAVVVVPVMMSFPKALFGYWLTSNIFSLTYGLVIKQPAIKKMLNIPEVLVPASPAVNQDLTPSSVSRLDEASEAASIQDEASKVKPSLSTESSKIIRKISAASVLSQRIRNLEKKIKAENKSRKS